ncbi:MAG: YdeI/OmpD-associated family protein [Caldilineaceae bacterium]
MTEQRFTATVEESGTSACVRLPFDPDAVWGQKDRHHVTGTVDGHRIRGPLTKTETGHVLTLGPAWRRDHPLADDEIEVVLAPEGPQLDGLADDIVAALDASPTARAFFESLATFYRKGYLRWINGARKPNARAERIAEVIQLLEAGKKTRK